MVLTGRGSYHSKNEEVERNRSQGCTKKRSPVLKESKLLRKKKKKVLYFVFVIGIIRKKWVADPKKTPENNPQSSAVVPEQK